MIKKTKWAVVTGASKGLGFHYCEELLKQGYNLIAIARNCNSVEQLKCNYNLEIKIFELDLSQINNCYQVFNVCLNLPIDLVINNAGFGILGNFIESNLDQEINMINLNLICIQILTKLFLQKMVLQGFGRIINIGSIASFFPGPAFASYYASKAYILNLSIAINTELKLAKSPVRVITICPGTLRTEFWNRSNAKKSKENLLIPKIAIMDLTTFAKKSLKKALIVRNKNIVIIGLANRFLLLLVKILPKRLFLRFIYHFQSQR